MKRLLLLLIFPLFYSYINAQTEITGFLGIKFEDSSYIALQKLKKRFSNVEWKYPSIHVKKPTFINTNFTDLKITYQNDKLYEAVFTLYYSDISFDHYLNKAEMLKEAQVKESAIVNNVAQTFNNLGNTLYSKYGSPTNSSTGNAIWRDLNSNSIALNTNYKREVSEIGIRMIGKVTITYRTANINNNEF